MKIDTKGLPAKQVAMLENPSTLLLRFQIHNVFDVSLVQNQVLLLQASIGQ
ncbi:TPA: hypothetical protein RTF81_002921 [Legionella pneumophila]|nr:hypothetical protein [Legionella pneumophila]